jgi:hypothetical protein
MRRDFDSLVGQEFDFYGTRESYLDFICLDGVVFEVEAGYGNDWDGTTYLGNVKVSDARDISFPTHPLARVRVGRFYSTWEFDGYELVDVETGHVWLKFGTQYTNTTVYVFDVENYMGPTRVQARIDCYNALNNLLWSIMGLTVGNLRDQRLIARWPNTVNGRRYESKSARKAALRGK